MNYTSTLKALKALRKRAVNCGLPSWVQAHVEERMNYARHWREASRTKESTKDSRDQAHQKAMLVLMSLYELLRAFSAHVRDDEPQLLEGRGIRLTGRQPSDNTQGST